MINNVISLLLFHFTVTISFHCYYFISLLLFQLSFVGGPSSNPDQVFTYKLPKFEMESAAAIKEMTGTMTFTFIDIKKVSKLGNSFDVYK